MNEIQQVTSNIRRYFILLAVSVTMSLVGFWFTNDIKNRDLTDSTILSMVNYADYMKKQESFYMACYSAIGLTTIASIFLIICLVISVWLLKLIKAEK